MEDSKKDEAARKKTRPGRTPKESPDTIKQSLIEYKNEIVVNGKVVPKNSSIWEKIRKEKGLKCSGLSLYTFVVCNRGNNIAKDLVVSKPTPEIYEDVLLDPDDVSENGNENNHDENENYQDENGNNVDDKIPDKNENVQTYTAQRRVFIPKDKWLTMKPVEVSYRVKDQSRPERLRTYLKLSPGAWCRILNFAIHDQTRLPCSWTFGPHYVAQTNEAEFYLKIHGKCQCGGKLIATCPNPLPADPEQSGLWLFVNIENARNDSHKGNKKIPIRGEARMELGNQMVNENQSASLVRKEFAGQNCQLFENEPGVVPRLTTLRKLKSQVTSREKMAPGEVESIRLLKYCEPYRYSISDLGDDPFFVHYMTPEQLRVYNAYAKLGYSRIILDSSGDIVQKILRPDGLSANIFLYSIVISLPGEHEGQVAIYQMLSERHNSNAICFWLMEWIRLGARIPQEIVIDFSPALVLSLCRVFAHVACRDDYLDTCFNYLQNSETSPRPPVLIRIDIAHFVNMITHCKSIKNMPKRAKEFYVRSIYLIALATSFEFAESVIRAIFIVASCETEGVSLSTEQATRCEFSKKYLLGLIGAAKEGMEFVNNHLHDQESCEENVDDPVPVSTTDEDSPPRKKGSLHQWLNTLYLDCTSGSNAVDDGDRDNLMFNTAFKKAFLDLCYKLPLWSNVMARVMHSPYENAVGAHVESHFNDLFSRLIKQTLRVDLFLQKHITILKNSMVLASTLDIFRKKEKCISYLLGTPKEFNCARCLGKVHEQEFCSTLMDDSIRVCIVCSAKHIIGLDRDEESQSNVPQINSRHDDLNTNPHKKLHTNPQEATSSTGARCPACATGNLPDPAGSHFCVICKDPVTCTSRLLGTCPRLRRGIWPRAYMFQMWFKKITISNFRSSKPRQNEILP